MGSWLRALSVMALLSQWADAAPPSPAPQLRTFALEDLVPLRKQFHLKRVAGEWMSETEFVFAEPGSGVKKYDASEAAVHTFLTPEEERHLQYPIASFGRDGRFILLATNPQKVFRYSSTAKYSIYDLQNKTSWPLAGGDLVQAFVWSPGARPAFAYVHNNNVFYVADVTNPLSVAPLTTTGVPGEVYNGISDWIYEEEILSSSQAMWFSTQGSYLAVVTFNDTSVESASYPVYGSPVAPEFQYPHLVKLKYPKTGRANPTVSLNVFPLVTDWSVYKPIVNIPAPASVGPEPILGHVDWASDNHVVVLWLNRRQNKSSLLKCDVVTATCENVRERYEPHGWIDVSETLFSRDGSAMVDISPGGPSLHRHNHLILRNFTDGTTRDLSPGNLTVNKIHAWNHHTDSIFFSSLPREKPWEVQLWSSTNGVNECVSCDKPDCRVTHAMFARGGRFGMITCISSDSVPRAYMYNVKTKEFRLWLDNEQLSKTLSQYKTPKVEFSVATLPGGRPAHIQLILPPDLDTTKKYPMVVKIYGGPSSTRVMDKRDLDYTTYLAGNRSVVACYLDVRGSGAMGLDNMFSVNNALGTVEVDDALDAIRYLTEKYPYIDADRVGVWGWSYGGYASAMMLARDNNTLRCAASVAPVTSWLYYDTIYTERYMGVPATNVAGYERSDLLLQARGLRGKKFLLIHGNADDNVHYQHSMMLSKILQHEDIEFDQMSYPDENHSLMSVSRHFYHTLDRHWTECFN